MKKNKYLSVFAVALFLLILLGQSKAQNDVMMQAFYWNVPVDVVNKNGTWWDTLRIKMNYLKKRWLYRLMGSTTI